MLWVHGTAGSNPATPTILGAGVGTQGGLINLSAPDERSRGGSNPSAPTI